MSVGTRGHCPSCRHRLSPFAVECPVCGLSLSRQSLPRPLLFQASALQHPSVPTEPRLHAISTPALGRVSPVAVMEPAPVWPEQPSPQLADIPEPLPTPELPETSFWPLVRVEFTEMLLLASLNGLFVILASLLCRAPVGRTYGELWPFLIPVHLCLSWAFVMVPMALTGQSPMMGPRGLLLDTSQPEKRLAFSIFHLVSVCLFPISFLCMVLTPEHRTLAELLTGQEILARPLSRLR